MKKKGIFMVEEKEKEKVKTVEEIEHEIQLRQAKAQQDAAEALSPEAQKVLVELTCYYEKNVELRDTGIFNEEVSAMVLMPMDQLEKVIKELEEAKFVSIGEKSRALMAPVIRPNGRGLHEGKKLTPALRAKEREEQLKKEEEASQSGRSEARTAPIEPTPPTTTPTQSSSRGRGSAPNID